MISAMADPFFNMFIYSEAIHQVSVAQWFPGAGHRQR